MHAFIIVSQKIEDRKIFIENALEKRGISPFDRIQPEIKTPLGIKDIRLFIKNLAIGSSTDRGKAGIIVDGDSMSLESQHALLKTLEEPPPNTTIYIGTSNISYVLPTIISRAERIEVAPSGETATANDRDAVISFVKELLLQKKGERILRLSRLGKTKEEIIAWVDTAIHLLHETDLQHYHHLIKHLLSAKKYQSNNVHPLLFIEHAFLMI